MGLSFKNLEPHFHHPNVWWCLDLGAEERGMVWTPFKLGSPLQNLNLDLGSDFEHPQILEVFGSGVLVQTSVYVAQSNEFNEPNAGIGSTKCKAAPIHVALSNSSCATWNIATCRRNIDQDPRVIPYSF